MKIQKSWMIPFIFLFLFFLINGLYGIWWLNLIFAFLLCYFTIRQKLVAFIICFIPIFLLWSFVSYWKDQEVSFVISTFLSALLQDLPSNMTYVLTGLIGGVITGWAGVLGSLLRNLLAEKAYV